MDELASKSDYKKKLEKAKRVKEKKVTKGTKAARPGCFASHLVGPVCVRAYVPACE